jgi:hypothetical protein
MTADSAMTSDTAVAQVRLVVLGNAALPERWARGYLPDLGEHAP